jgi:hypothetical protein
MQRLHEDDLVGHVLQQGQWRVLSFPAIAVEDEMHTIRTPYGTRTVRRSVGEALHPERESLEVLNTIRSAQGEYNFAGQYNSTPTLTTNSHPLDGLRVPEWFAVYVMPRHEKRIAEHFRIREIDHFLPLYQARRKWKDGSKVTLQLPLFPGYIFVRSERVLRKTDARGARRILHPRQTRRRSYFRSLHTFPPRRSDSRQSHATPLSGRWDARPHQSGIMSGMEGILVRIRKQPTPSMESRDGDCSEISFGAVSRPLRKPLRG